MKTRRTTTTNGKCASYFDELEDLTEWANVGVVAEPVTQLHGWEWDVSRVFYMEEAGSEQTVHQVYHPNPEHIVAKTPTMLGVLMKYITSTNGVTWFFLALHTFLCTLDPQYDYPNFTDYHWSYLWMSTHPFRSPLLFNLAEGSWTDVVNAQPEKQDQRIHVSWWTRFDTALIESNEDIKDIHHECIPI